MEGGHRERVYASARRERSERAAVEGGRGGRRGRGRGMKRIDTGDVEEPSHRYAESAKPEYEEMDQEAGDDAGVEIGFEVEPTEENEYPGGPVDTSVLTNYHVHTVRQLYEGNVRDALKCVSNGKKVKTILRENKDAMQAKWFVRSIKQSRLYSLRRTSYDIIDHGMLSGFVERWHEETSSIHLLSGEMTMTLDDVACLLHLPIEGRLLAHDGPMTRDEAVDLMVEQLRADPGLARKNVDDTKGAHAKLSFLRNMLVHRFKDVTEVEAEGNLVRRNTCRDQCIRIFLLYLLGVTIFNDKSQNYVDVTYLRYLIDVEMIHRYAWGTAALVHLYRELNVACYYKARQLSRYCTLLQAWIFQRFQGHGSKELWPAYREFFHPRAMGSGDVDRNSASWAALESILDEMRGSGTYRRRRRRDRATQ